MSTWQSFQVYDKLKTNMEWGKVEDIIIGTSEKKVGT